MDSSDIKIEWLACTESVIYFLDRYCQIYDATERSWIPFNLWPAQAKTLRVMQTDQLIVILKARQLGITWLALGFALWRLLFYPVATVLLFSKRDDEARYLLGDERLKGMYKRLPGWMQARAVTVDNGHVWSLSNGSVARAFPTSAGDSYTASLVICDEFDLVENQGALMNAVKPTIDGGGKMILLSRSENNRPQSDFKKTYVAAKAGKNGWTPIFLPWHTRPSRTQDWYERQKADILHRTGSLDDLHQQYPATDMEALSPRTMSKRLASDWLLKCFAEMDTLQAEKSPAIPGLRFYTLPKSNRHYVIGADPAEGNPTSDDSSFHVLDALSGEEVAHLAGKFQPSTFASHIDKVGRYYNNASALVERNNHGHAVLLWLRDNSKLRRLRGSDGKEGWHSTSLGKALMYDAMADALRDQTTLIHTPSTYLQLTNIEGSTLRAPEGDHDDDADSFALATLARPMAKPSRMAVV